MHLIRAMLMSGLGLASVAHAESMRCGKWVVNEEASAAEILQKCGEPKSRETRTEEVSGRNALGNPIKLGTTTIERWLYQAPGGLPRVVTVVDGKVKSIERSSD